MSNQRQPDGLYHIRLEQWTEHGQRLEKVYDCQGVGPWNFALPVWSELARVCPMPGVQGWVRDDDGDPSAAVHQERIAKIAELEQMLTA